MAVEWLIYQKKKLNLFLSKNDHIQYKNKINGNVGEPHTEGKNCDKRQYYWTSNRF